jgi:hypothetical protein
MQAGVDAMIARLFLGAAGPLADIRNSPIDARELPRDVQDAMIVALGGTPPPPRNRSDVVVGDEVRRALEVRDGKGDARAGSSVVRTSTQSEGVVAEFDSILEMLGQTIGQLHDRVMKFGGLPPPKEGGDAGSDPNGDTFLSQLNIRMGRLRRQSAQLRHVTDRVVELV